MKLTEDQALIAALLIMERGLMKFSTSRIKPYLMAIQTMLDQPRNVWDYIFESIEPYKDVQPAVVELLRDIAHPNEALNSPEETLDTVSRYFSYVVDESTRQKILADVQKTV